jgi:hypothetical protein
MSPILAHDPNRCRLSIAAWPRQQWQARHPQEADHTGARDKPHRSYRLRATSTMRSIGNSRDGRVELQKQAIRELFSQRKGNDMIRILAFLHSMVLVVAIASPSAAQDMGRSTHLPDLKGSWTGRADFMLPDGITLQLHHFEFSEQSGEFLRGRHKWDILAKNLKSHDGVDYRYQSTEEFLGVVGYDGTIWIVEHGDHTMFRLRILNRDAIELIALEGGEHPLVGHGILVRE